MKRILIVDENTEILKSFQCFFSNEDLKYVDLTDSPSRAIKLLGKNEYESVITDYYFLKENIGAKKILKTALDNNVEKRIVLTSVSKTVNADDCFATFLTRKPITKKKFIFLCKGDAA